MRNMAILIFNDVEVLDFCGPFEVFSVASEINRDRLLNVFTVAEGKKPVLTRNGLSVNPKYTLEDCPDPAILLVPGGRGTRTEMHNPTILDWIRKRASSAELILSVCTGALLLAKSGLLEGLRATTHHGALDLLREVAPNTQIVAKERIIDNGRVMISAGISAGIDMSLYVVAKLFGEQLAEKTAAHMEYNYGGFNGSRSQG